MKQLMHGMREETSQRYAKKFRLYGIQLLCCDQTPSNSFLFTINDFD